MEYFFDSYAIIEIIDQNKNYIKFKDAEIITTVLHLAEVYYSLLRNYNEQTADYWVNNLNISFLDITSNIAIRSSKFRHKNKKAKLSYADCIGYLISLENNMKFITGDKQFESFKGVEFVK
ncbi:MAG: PIN domain-containing protein [Candidatus Nanoarchaeia archaeon]